MGADLDVRGRLIDRAMGDNWGLNTARWRQEVWRRVARRPD